MKIAVIGFGAIGQFLVNHLKSEPAIQVVSVLSASPPTGSIPTAASIDELLNANPDMVVECAGHQALQQYGPPAMRAGKDLLIASVGALADRSLEEKLKRAAGSGARLLIPAGALGGLDLLQTAKEAGLHTVEYVGRKGPAAWKGTAAEDLVDLRQVKRATTFLEGDARTAATTFPQNANVVAALSLAGLGFERTKVRLVVDPDATDNHHSYIAKGDFGEMSVNIASATLSANPKTSVLAPFSIIQTLKAKAGIAVT